VVRADRTRQRERIQAVPRAAAGEQRRATEGGGRDELAAREEQASHQSPPPCGRAGTSSPPSPSPGAPSASARPPSSVRRMSASPSGVAFGCGRGGLSLGTSRRLGSVYSTWSGRAVTPVIGLVPAGG